MTFLDEVVAGLSSNPRRISSKHFYDTQGSQLFEQICELDEYYITRTEMALLTDRASEMAEHVGPHAAVIEFGSGSGQKTSILMHNLKAPQAWIPIDISQSALADSASRMRDAFPDLNIAPVHGDFTHHVQLPNFSGKRLVFYPGSTIGNFTPPEVDEFLTRVHRLVGQDGGLLIGVDLKKSAPILHHAYNDARGVTSAFNKNLLHRMQRELHANLDPEMFEHYAFFNPVDGRIEMHLVASAATQISVNNLTFKFQPGEGILTEYSYKYSRLQFEEIAQKNGFSVQNFWSDPQNLFGIWFLKPASELR